VTTVAFVLSVDCGWVCVLLTTAVSLQDCLPLLADHCRLDSTTLLSVASQQCRPFLDGLGK